jgi:hypothetical protein
MNNHFQSLILKATNATALSEAETIQSLWSGYGEIVRYGLKGSNINSVVVKYVRLPDQSHHPRGWNTDLSHQRKIKSNQVEIAWYSQWANLCSNDCRVPHSLATESYEDEMFILLEDLDYSGFPVRKTNVSTSEIKACLSWLAHFHATFMNQQPQGLWPEGTYWHLDTRPDELDALQDLTLKKAAKQIAQTLSDSTYQTFVHGDAKLANFCFSPSGKQVAAVDFQYVGGGCGMKDVAYFIGSCLNEHQCQQQETALLDFYFQVLKEALVRQQKQIDVNAVEQEWRVLYPIAWTDFHRFVKGWSPGHWKINSYSEQLAHEVIEMLPLVN